MKHETGGKRFLIGVDMDDVLFDCCNTLNAFHNETYGSIHARADYSVYDLAKVWGCTYDDIKERVNAYYKTDYHHDAQPVVGSVESIVALKENHDLCVITARNEETSRAATEKWLAQHFPGMFNSVHFISHFYGSAPAQTKREVCDELGVDLFIDDALHNAIDIAAAHRPVLLLDNPWNQGELPPHVNRIYSWNDALQYIQEKAFDATPRGER